MREEATLDQQSESERTESKAGVMTIGALAGYYLGSHYSQRISQAAVRRIVSAIGFVLSGVTFYKEFVQ